MVVSTDGNCAYKWIIKEALSRDIDGSHWCSVGLGIESVGGKLCFSDCFCYAALMSSSRSVETESFDNLAAAGPVLLSPDERNSAFIE
jgi:hypothetical protein